MPPSSKIIKIMSNLPIFMGLKNEELLKMFALCKKEEYKVGKYVFKQGEKSSKIFLLIKGKISVIVDDIIISKIDTVTSIGEIGAFLNLKRISTIKTLEDSAFLVLPILEIKKLMSENTILNNHLIYNISLLINDKLNSNNHVLLQLSEEKHNLSQEYKVISEIVPDDIDDSLLGPERVYFNNEELVYIPKIVQAFVAFYNLSGSYRLEKFSENRFRCECKIRPIFPKNTDVSGYLFIGKHPPIKFVGTPLQNEFKNITVTIKEVNQDYHTILNSLVK